MQKRRMRSDILRYISTTTVRPISDRGSLKRIDLTPWDLNLLRLEYMQKGLLFLKPKKQEGEQETIPINHLKSSFSSVLDYYYPLAGRLAIETHADSTISFFINCNGAGAEFIHTKVDITVADVLDPTNVPPIVHSFFPLNKVINYEGIFQPLLAVQVTELVDGIFVGCSMNHSVADGTPFWHFFNNWSEIARTSNPIISHLPVFERWFLNESSCPVRFPSSIEDEFIHPYMPPPLEERFFNFTRQTLSKLKAKANEEQGTKTISSLQALLGHIWRATTRARHLESTEEVMYTIQIGNRMRLNPRLPEEYFGNSIAVVVVRAKAGELEERGLGWAAGLLNQAVTSRNDATIRSSLEIWMKAPVLASLLKSPNHLHTGSSTWFDMYGNDFGWGRPIAVRGGPANKFDGKMTVHPGSIEGSVDVEACLPPQTLKAMDQDIEFMEVF